VNKRRLNGHHEGTKHVSIIRAVPIIYDMYNNNNNNDNIRRLLSGCCPKYFIFSTSFRTYFIIRIVTNRCSVVGDLASGPQYLQLSCTQSKHNIYGINLYTILPIYYYIIVCSALMGTPKYYTHFHGPVRYFTRVGTQRYTVIIIFIVGCRIV